MFQHIYSLSKFLSYHSEHMLQCASVQSCSSGPTHRFMSAQGGKAAYLSAHVRGGVLPTHCVLELSETQSGSDRI